MFVGGAPNPLTCMGKARTSAFCQRRELAFFLPGDVKTNSFVQLEGTALRILFLELQRLTAVRKRCGAHS